MGMEETTSGMLSLKTGFTKGDNVHNGLLKKIHDFSLTEGYSVLTHPVEVVPEFGFGVFEDNAVRSNAVSTAVTGMTTPAFGGILVRNPAITAGQPAANKQVLPHNKTVRARRGFLVYKKGWTLASTPVIQTFANILRGMNMFVNNANGRPFFSANATESGATYAGRVVMLNPDDSSWTVEITPAPIAVAVSSITLSQISDLNALTVEMDQITDLDEITVAMAQITDLDDLNINQLAGVNFTTLSEGQILKADATGVLVPAADAIA